MRRFFSWIVLVLLTLVFSYAQYWVWVLVQNVYLFFYDLSPVVFWVIIIVGGLGLARAAFWGLTSLSFSVIQLTQAIHHTHNGARYKVVGIFTIVLNVINLICTIYLVKNNSYVARPLCQFLSCITMIVFGGILTASARETAISDGPPLTERERLQAKLDRLDEKEREKKL